MKFLYLIPLFPLLGFLFNFIVGVVSCPADGAPATAMVTVTRRAALAARRDRSRGLRDRAALVPGPVYAVLDAHGAPGHTLVETLWTWIPGGAAETAAGAAAFQVDWAYQVDPLSSVMILVVTFVGFFIHVYSTGYMGHDAGYARYMSYLNLFMFAMLTLVLGANYAGAVRGLGGRRPLLVPADRLLVRQAERGRRGQEGVHRQPHRRRGLRARDVPDLLHLRQPGLPHRDGRGRAPAGGVDLDGALTADRPLPVRRRQRQERADPALRLAARRHGRPDAGLGPDPRRHHGDGGRVHGGALRRDLRARAQGAVRGGPRRRRSPRSSPPPSASCRTTSSACWPTPRSASSATCSWPAGWARSRPASST